MFGDDFWRHFENGHDEKCYLKGCSLVPDLLFLHLSFEIYFLQLQAHPNVFFTIENSPLSNVPLRLGVHRHKKAPPRP